MVSRVWLALGLALHKHDWEKPSRDPLGVAIVRDVIGLTSHDYVRHGTSSRRPHHRPQPNPHQPRHLRPTNQRL